MHIIGMIFFKPEAKVFLVPQDVPSNWIGLTTSYNLTFFFFTNTSQVTEVGTVCEFSHAKDYFRNWNCLLRTGISYVDII